MSLDEQTTTGADAHRAQLLAAFKLTRAEVDGFRTTARDPATASGEPGERPESSPLEVAVGFVRVYSFRTTEGHNSKYSSAHEVTRHALIVDARDLGIDDGVAKLVVDGGAYRVFFANGSVRALEPVAVGDVPDAVADAVRAVGLDPSDSAARSDPRVVAIVRDELIESLARGFGFSTLDLGANRAGRLSARERKRLMSSALVALCVALVAGSLGVLTTWAARSSLVVAVGVAVVFGFGVVLAVVMLLGYLRDAVAGRVVSAVAHVRLKKDGGRILVLENGLTFSLPEVAFSARGHQPKRLAGLAYRAYYAPRSTDTLLSLEPIDVAPLLAKP